MTPLVVEGHNSSTTAADSSNCFNNGLYDNNTLSNVIVAVEALVSVSSSPSLSFSYEQQRDYAQQQHIFSERQQKVLAILPMCTGFISMISSALIIYLITTEDSRNKRRMQQQKDHFKKLHRKELESLQVASNVAETAGRYSCGVNSEVDVDDKYNLDSLDSGIAAARSTIENFKTTAPTTATFTRGPRRRISSIDSNSSNGSNAVFVPVNRTFQRIMIGLSTFNVFTAVGVFASTLPVPGETNVWMASGTTTTCEIQGVFIQAGLSSSLYSASLAIYFAISIVPNCNKWCFSIERIEPLLHGVPIVFAIGTSVLGLIFDAFNPIPAGIKCWLSEYPTGCSYDATTDQTDAAQCLRGKYVNILFWIFSGFPLIASISVIVLLMTWMYFSVWYQLRKVESRYLGSQSFSTDAIGTGYSKSDNRRQQQQQRKELSPRSKERLRNVASQAFLYILVFFIAYICPTISRLTKLSNRNDFAVSIISSLCYPSQGFFNLLVYLRPRYLQIRRTYFPEISRIDAIKISLGILPEPNPSLHKKRRTAAARRRSTATKDAQHFSGSIIMNDVNVMQTNRNDENDNGVTKVTTQSNSQSSGSNSNNDNKHSNGSDDCYYEESNLGNSATIDFVTSDDSDIFPRPRNPPPPLLAEDDICEQREIKSNKQNQQQQKQYQDNLNHDDSEMTIETNAKLFSSWPSVDEDTKIHAPSG